MEHVKFNIMCVDNDRDDMEYLAEVGEIYEVYTYEKGIHLEMFNDNIGKYTKQNPFIYHITQHDTPNNKNDVFEYIQKYMRDNWRIEYKLYNSFMITLE